LHFVEFGTYLQCLTIHVENENVQFFIIFFFSILFIYLWKGYEKANPSTQIVGIGDFCPQKSWGNFSFLNSRHHPSIHSSIHLFSQKKDGWIGPRVRKDGFVMGTRHPLQAQYVHDTGQTCVLASSIHPSIHPSMHLFSKKKMDGLGQG